MHSKHRQQYYRKRVKTTVCRPIGTRRHGALSLAQRVHLDSASKSINGTGGWDWVSGYHYSDSLMGVWTFTP